MADISDPKYVIPCSNRPVIDTAIRNANQMLAQTRQRLQAGPANIPEDTRLWTPLHQAYVDIFKVQVGLQSMAQIQQIKGNFDFLAQAVTRVKPVCVSDAHPFIKQKGQMGHEAFAEVGTDSSPTIYFGSPFFRNTPRYQARTVVHELAHGRLGVGHAGGEFLSFVTDDVCEPTPLRTFEEAISNAYAYDRFAECASSSR